MIFNNIKNIDLCFIKCNNLSNICVIDIGENEIDPEIKQILSKKNIVSIKLSKVKIIDIEQANNSNKKLLLYYHNKISPLNISDIYMYSNITTIYFCNFNFLLIKLQPKDILPNLSYIEDFIKVFFMKNDDNKSKLSINQFSGRKKITLDRIKKDILFLKSYNKLTSRLAIFIYKICTFDIRAGDKEIGLYFSRFFGKSKLLNKKRFEIVNVKGYKISNNIDPTYYTRYTIAQKLLAKRGESITSSIINEVTGINVNSNKD